MSQHLTTGLSSLLVWPRASKPIVTRMDYNHASSAIINGSLTIADFSKLPPSILLNLKCITSLVKNKPYIPNKPDKWDIESSVNSSNEENTDWFKNPCRYNSQQVDGEEKLPVPANTPASSKESSPVFKPTSLHTTWATAESGPDSDNPITKISRISNQSQNSKGIEDDSDEADFCVDEDLFVSGFIVEKSPSVLKTSVSGREVSLNKAGPCSVGATETVSADNVPPSPVCRSIPQVSETSACGPEVPLHKAAPCSVGATETVSADNVHPSPVRRSTPRVLPPAPLPEVVTSAPDIHNTSVVPTSHQTSFSLDFLPVTNSFPEEDRFQSCPYIFSSSTIVLPTQCTWKWIDHDCVLPAQLDVNDALSDGTFSHVYLMHYESKDIIVKVFKNDGQTKLESLIREADIAMLMGTYGVGPSVPGVLDQGPGSHLPAIAMEALPDANDLHNLVAQDPLLSSMDVLDIFAQAARMITFIHQRGFIHNDIKMTNMLIVPKLNGEEVGTVPQPESTCGYEITDGLYRVYLIDFGQTTHDRGAYFDLSDEDMEIFQDYPYLAPEVVSGAPTNTSSDVYSFGMAMQKATQFMRDESLKLALAALIAQCTHADSSRRPTMEEVEGSLQRRLRSPLTRQPVHPTVDDDTDDDDSGDDDDDDDDGQGGDVVPLPLQEAVNVEVNGAENGAGVVQMEAVNGDAPGAENGAGGAHIMPNPVAGPSVVGSYGEGNNQHVHVLSPAIQAFPPFFNMVNPSFSTEDAARNHGEYHLRRVTRNIFNIHLSSMAIHGDSSLSSISDTENDNEENRIQDLANEVD